MKKIALIFGITGQDGILLSRYLIKKKYKVYGYIRNIKKKKYLDEKVKLLYKKKLTKEFFFSIVKKTKPTEIYFLIGQSNSYVSFKKPAETFETNFLYFCHIVEACLRNKLNPRIFYASSGEVFGSSNKILNENSEKKPQNPYALSKYLSMIYIKYMREFFNLKISTGILFNHDSEYRNENNFSKKIINYLNKSNFKKKLNLGNIDLLRDFGLSKEYIVAIYKINQRNKGDDYIIATGKSLKLRQIIDYSFSLKKLNYKKYTKINKKKFLKNEIKFKGVNISKIKKLNWKPSYNILDFIKQSIK